MPQAIIISPVESEYLKSALENRYGFSITDTNDCKKISHEINESSGKRISYNTIRRLFKIIPSIGGISLHSLNLLAGALQHNSWKDLKESQYEYQVAHNNHVIHSFNSSGDIDHDRVMKIIGKMKLEDWASAYWLKEIVRLALEQNDHALIKKILLHPFELDTETKLDKLYFSLQDIHFQLPKNKKVLDLLLHTIPKSPTAQTIFGECYVNESELNGYFGKVLKVYIESKKNDLHANLFYQLLMCQYEYEVETKKKRCLPFYEGAIEIYYKMAPEKINPILKGRLSAWQWILEEKDELYKASISQLKTGIEWAHFNDFFHRLCVKCSPHGMYPTFDKFPGNQHSRHLTFFADRIYAHENLLAAIHHYLKNNVDYARDCFGKINPYNFDVSNADWYNGWYKKLEPILKNHPLPTPVNIYANPRPNRVTGY